MKRANLVDPEFEKLFDVFTNDQEENHFEPAAIDVPATNEDGLMSMKHEMAQILAIIDRLSLYDPRKMRAAQMGPDAQ